MLIGLISDLHGNAAGTAAGLQLLAGCDRVLCAGDVFNQYGGDPRVVELLMEADVQVVPGNHDVDFVRFAPRADHWEAARAFLAGLPAQRRMEMGGETVRLVHGAPWDPHPGRSTYLFPHMVADPRLRDLCGLLVVGHNHLAFARAASPLLTVVSPGSCGVVDPRGQLHAGFVDTAANVVQLIAFTLQGERPLMRSVDILPLRALSSRDKVKIGRLHQHLRDT